MLKWEEKRTEGGWLDNITYRGQFEQVPVVGDGEAVMGHKVGHE